VADVLGGKAPCDPAWYFMFSQADVYALGLQNLAPVAKFQVGKNNSIWIFEYWYSRRKH